MTLLSRSNRAFRAYLVAVASCAVLSLLPARWLRWTADVGAVVQLPTVPFGLLGSRLTEALRSRTYISEEQTDDIWHLREEMETFRSLYLAVREENESLKVQIDQLQRAQRADGGTNVRLQQANIVSRDLSGGSGMFTLDVGRNREIRQGAVAVYNGTHLIGRVSQVFPLTSTLIPVTDPSNEFIEARVIAPSSSDPRLRDHPPRVQLKVMKGVGFQADLPRDIDVRVGDLVLLFDPLWPESAQAMTLGTIRSISPRDDHPLLQSIEVRPQFEASRIASVTVKNEERGILAQGGNGNP